MLNKNTCGRHEHLILDEGHQRRDDNGDAGEQQRRQLIAQALPCRCRERTLVNSDRKSRAAVEQVLQSHAQAPPVQRLLCSHSARHAATCRSGKLIISQKHPSTLGLQVRCIIPPSGHDHTAGLPRHDGINGLHSHVLPF